MAERVLILSDLHLGRSDGPVRTVDDLAPLWAGFDRLVLNGDVAEIHHPEDWGRAAREVLALLDRCETDGVDLTILSGNHDPYLSDIRHLELAGGSVFVTHGDVMHPAVAPWSPAAGRMRRAHEAAIASMNPGARGRLESRLRVSQHASFAEWSDHDAIAREAARNALLSLVLRPWAAWQIVQYWRAFPRLAADFAAEHAPEARLVVTGHTHRPGVWRIGPRTILNTGSFAMPCRPRAVVLDGDAATDAMRVTMHRVRRGTKTWSMDARALGTWTVPTERVAGSSAADPSRAAGTDASSASPPETVAPPPVTATIDRTASSESSRGIGAA